MSNRQAGHFKKNVNNYSNYPKIKPSLALPGSALFRGDEIRTHGGVAPTRPFQDRTINHSDTPLCDFIIYYYN